MTLTRDQKIKRAITRHNNKVKRELPLLAPLLETNYTEQAERYSVMDSELEAYKARLDELDQTLQMRGAEDRAYAAKRYTKYEMDAFDRRYAKVFSGLGWEYFADYWRKICIKAEVAL